MASPLNPTRRPSPATRRTALLRFAGLLAVLLALTVQTGCCDSVGGGLVNCSAHHPARRDQ